MKHVGIICEYNPFHTGHARLLEAVQGAETVICLMSGHFTQRGEAAILPSAVRAEMAIEAGADLVLELPFPIAASSASYFATGAVRALGALGVDTLAFGSETGDEKALLALAEQLPTGNFRKNLADGAQNVGDAAAYFMASGADISSNDILGVAYLHAISRLKLKMTPFVLKREGAAYLEKELEGQQYPSATALRQCIKEGGDVHSFLPAASREAFLKGAEKYGFADTAKLGTALLARLRTSLSDTVSGDIAECGGGLLERLQKAAMEASDYESLCRAAATKRYTDGRIRRALLCLLAGVKKEDLTAPPAYLRLLGASERGRKYLAKTAKTRTVPVVTRPCEIVALGEKARRQRELALSADALFSLCLEKPLTPHALQTMKPYFKTFT